MGKPSLDFADSFSRTQMFEYAADASTVLRSTRTDYVDDNTTINAAPYLSRRIFGLAREQRLYEGNVNNGGTLMSRVGFDYDQTGSIQGTDAPVQHDNTNYGATFITGRGNLSTITRYDVTNGASTTSTMKYNTAGAVVSSKDALQHETKIDYTDSFSFSVAQNTLAYPTKVTDPDGYYSTSQYNFDFGALTSRKTPPPNYTGAPAQQPAGPETVSLYDDLGRLERTKNLVNNAYTRFMYNASAIRVDSYATIEDGEGEAHSFKITDGLGRVIGTASDHASSPTTFSGQGIVYDVMGRIIKRSNPAETSANGNNPALWEVVGDDALMGWVYTQQTYDWKGRPLITTNPSLTSNPNETTTREASYTGCGCAGGEIVTVTDEGTLDGGVAKRRQQKIYSDVLGRTVRTELLNWQNGTPYSTTVIEYNVRDQVTLSTRYEGPAGSSNYQQSSMTYDGFGRLLTSHSPEQQPEPNNNASSDHTTFHYNPDDTVDYVIDARGVVKTLNYNSRQLVTGINYNLGNIPPAYNYVASTADATFTYDAVGRRMSAADGTGTMTYHYNGRSQLDSETRQFAGPLSGVNYTLSYQYNLGGELQKITDHTNTTINYDYYKTGALKNVTGEKNLVGQVSNYASGIQYRAWGAVRDISLGNATQQHTDFNSRLLPNSYSLNNLVIATNSSASMTWTYDYYNDGRQRHALGSYDRFDRLLEYDQVGRLKEAYSGREARGLAASSPVPDSPYRQTFQYNAFDERTQKSGRFWRTAQSGSTPCTPRQANDGCDGEGNLLNNLDSHRYDAAGKQVHFENWHYTVGDGTVNHPVDSGAIIDQTYDGNGQAAKRVETRRREELVNGGPDFTIVEDVTTTYYLYSSVLGGAKVVELDANGNKTTGYVYANGRRLAKQLVQGSNSVVWYNANPGTNSWVETGVERVPGQQEMDPDGAEVGLADPWIDPIEPPNYINFKDEPLYIEGGDPFDYSSGFTVDGMPVSQVQLAHMLDIGAVGAGIFFHGRHIGTASLEGGGLFGVPTAFSIRIDFWGQVNSQNSNDIFSAPDEENRDASIDTATTSHAQHWMGALVLNVSFWRLLPSTRPTGPQNPITPNNIDEIKKRQREGPCAGIKITDLDYSKVRDYYKGKHLITESAKDHIMRNHIDGRPGKSRYETDPPQDREAMFLQVQFYNAVTFGLGMQINNVNKKGDLVGISFVFSFPPVPYHPVYQTKGMGWIGRDQNGNTTLLKTLHLDPDCKTVRNSYPGKP